MSVSSIFEGLNSDLNWLKDRTIFLSHHGSVAYGTSTPESDVDYRGIAIPPKEYYTGFVKNFEQLVRSEPDAQIFEIRKFFKLALANNPNVLEILFTDEQDHLIVTPLGRKILDHRERFISKLCKETFLGYAKAQAHRIAQHRSWLLNKVEDKPTREEFGLKDPPEISKTQYQAIKSQINKKLDSWNPDFEPFSEAQKIYLKSKISDYLAEVNITSDTLWMAAARSLGFSENFIFLVQKEKEFEGKLENWKNYQNWKKNRNPKRAVLEEKFGYDLKHASHLVRLSRMAKEILESGKVVVKRPDAEELRAIRSGAWTYDQLIMYIEKLESEIKSSYYKSVIPASPDRNFLSALCGELIEEASFGHRQTA